MDVEDRLARVAVRVEHDAVAAGGNAAFRGDRRRAPRQFADDLIVVRREIVQRLDVALGDRSARASAPAG